MPQAEVLGTGGFVPPKVVPNEFFSYLVEEDADAWIHSRTGIKERRFAEPEVSTSDLATQAALQALENAKLSPLDIDCLIVATSTPDMILPATACMVQKNIGAENAFAFDMNAVCSSFIYGLEICDNLIRSGKYRRIMLIGADTYSKILNMDDKGSAPLFGDGAGCIIFGATDSGRGILHTVMKSDGKGWDLITVPSSGSRCPITAETIASKDNTFKMAGKSVFTFATNVIPTIIEDLSVKGQVSLDQIDHIIPHQANVRIIDFISKRTGIAKEKFLLNLDRYGNTAAASVGLALDENRRNGTIKPGQLVLLMGFGGGLSWGGVLIQF